MAMPGGNLWIIVLILIVVSRVIAAMAEKSQQRKEQQQQQQRRQAGAPPGRPHQVQTRPSLQVPPTHPGQLSRPLPAPTLGQSAAAARGNLAARRKAQLEELRKRRLGRSPTAGQPPTTGRPGSTLAPFEAFRWRLWPAAAPQPLCAAIKSLFVRCAQLGWLVKLMRKEYKSLFLSLRKKLLKN